MSLPRGCDGPVHYPLPNGHCAWSILPVGGPNGILRGTASPQQAGYTRVGHLGRWPRGCSTDTAGLSLAWAPAPRGGPGGKPRCRALWAEGDPLSIPSQAGWLCLRALLASKLFCEGRAWLFLGSGMRRAGDQSRCRSSTSPWPQLVLTSHPMCPLDSGQGDSNGLTCRWSTGSNEH